MSHVSKKPTTPSIRLTVSGRVQGVGFRWFVERAAGELGLTGLARNCDDGTVEVNAYGNKINLERLLLDCRRGPCLAKVESIDVDWDESDNPPPSFVIK